MFRGMKQDGWEDSHGLVHDALFVWQTNEDSIDMSARVILSSVADGTGDEA